MAAPITLLCLPCAGASATMYLRWRRLLPAWVRVEPVELAGRGSRINDPFSAGFEAAVDDICARAQPWVTGRYALYGHSMGALLAYGATRRLRALGMPAPQLLIASGSASPSARDNSRLERMRGRGDLLEDLRRQGGTPQAVFDDEELLALTLAVLEADYALCLDYQHHDEAPLALPVHVMGGRRDDIAPERLRAWQDVARHPVTLDYFDGGHFFIRDSEPAVLAAITAHLGRPLAASEGIRHASLDAA
ncbi:thioesterase II family protein [Achromobacter pestifer]|uniref:Linear gramicidin dehydrogenase LgrE n=1 Tax=Achromobacter pestifer TaxID=1353889 RepID=A0A6S6YQ23_9BURK|nr:alpha/beta fold hydrolase [Achromobacter pestifer]CAB3628312.1 Linear gramicidin dehydrogenase LgrE [Achromobacter pestifer]